MTINVENIKKDDLLLTLYNNAKPQGLGALQYTSKPMDKEEAVSIILNWQCEPDSCSINTYLTKHPIGCPIANIIDNYFSYIIPQGVFTRIGGECGYTYLNFDDLKGRIIKTDISRDEIDLWLYKRDNPHVDIEEILTKLNNGESSAEAKTTVNTAQNIPYDFPQDPDLFVAFADTLFSPKKEKPIKEPPLEKCGPIENDLDFSTAINNVFKTQKLKEFANHIFEEYWCHPHKLVNELNILCQCNFVFRSDFDHAGPATSVMEAPAEVIGDQQEHATEV